MPNDHGSRALRGRPEGREGVAARGHLTLGAVLLSTLSFPVTITGTSVALTSFQQDLDAELSSAQWVVNGYNAALAAFLLLTGALADVLGPRRAFRLGVGLFCAASVVCAAAPNIVVLNAARILAAIGAAAAITGASALLATRFAGAARARAFSLLGTVLGAGLAFGPTISGGVIELLGWRGVFAVPAAMAGLAVLLSVERCPSAPPRGQEPPAGRFDTAGSVLFTIALLLLIGLLIEGPEVGLSHPVSIIGLVALGTSCVAFVIVERRAASPVVEVDLLRRPGFAAPAGAAAVLMIVLTPLLVYLPSYFIAELGMTPGEAGVLLLLLSLPTVLLPPVGARVLARTGRTPFVAGCLILVGTGSAGLLVISPQVPLGVLALPLLAIGAATGLATGQVDGLAISSVPPERSGSAAGLFNTARIASETVGIAVVGAVIASASGGRLSGPGFTAGVHVTGVAFAAVALLAAVVVVVSSRRTPAEPGSRTTNPAD